MVGKRQCNIRASSSPLGAEISIALTYFQLTAEDRVVGVDESLVAPLARVCLRIISKHWGDLTLVLVIPVTVVPLPQKVKA